MQAAAASECARRARCVLLSIVALVLLLGGAVEGSTPDDECERFRLNAERGAVSDWLVPPECECHVKDYIDRGQYYSDVQAVSDAAAAFLDSKSASDDRKDALIFDLDETLLSNLQYYDQHHYGVEKFNATSWGEWAAECRADGLQPMLELLKHIQQSSNFSIILLTGRSEDERKCTEKNLRAVGCTDWLSLTLRSPAEKGLTALQYKSARREALEMHGYRLVANFGDQWSDLQGPASGERQFKIPNPMYYIG